MQLSRPQQRCRRRRASRRSRAARTLRQSVVRSRLHATRWRAGAERLEEPADGGSADHRTRQEGRPRSRSTSTSSPTARSGITNTQGQQQLQRQGRLRRGHARRAVPDLGCRRVRTAARLPPPTRFTTTWTTRSTPVTTSSPRASGTDAGFLQLLPRRRRTLGRAVALSWCRRPVARLASSRL